MEEILVRFHQIGKKIFEELDNQSLTKCREVTESWRGFINGEKTVPFRIIKSLTNVPDTYLKNNFGKVYLASVTELVKNIQHAYSEVHIKQRNFKFHDLGLRQDGKNLKVIWGYLEDLPIILHDENDLEKLKTGKLFLTPTGIVSKSHPTNPSSGYGETALHIAAKNGYLNV